MIERLRGVSHTLADAGYQLILHDVERPDQRRDLFRSLAARGQIDGLLAISLAPADGELRRLEQAGVPIVLLDRSHATIPCITIDDVEGGRMAAEHLLALGHRRIAFLGDEEANLFGFDSSARRRQGFEAALAAACGAAAAGAGSCAGRTAARPRAPPPPSCSRGRRARPPSSPPPTSRRSGCSTRRRRRAVGARGALGDRLRRRRGGGVHEG